MHGNARSSEVLYSVGKSPSRAVCPDLLQPDAIQVGNLLRGRARGCHCITNKRRAIRTADKGYIKPDLIDSNLINTKCSYRMSDQSVLQILINPCCCLGKEAGTLLSLKEAAKSSDVPIMEPRWSSQPQPPRLQHMADPPESPASPGCSHQAPCAAHE